MSDAPRIHKRYATNCIENEPGYTVDFRAVCLTCADDHARREAGLDVQPEPVPTERRSSHNEAIDEMRRRKAFGLEKYGNTLTAGNGRNSVQDVVDELADALVYAITERSEREELEKVWQDVAEHGDEDPKAALRLFRAVGRYLGKVT